MKSLPSNVSVIIPAAGSGSRAGFDKNKLLVNFEGSPALLKTVRAFDIDEIFEIIVCVNKNDTDKLSFLSGIKKVVLCTGGKTRFESVKNALEKVKGDIVLIHDGARPYVTHDIIKNCIDSVKKFGSGVAAVKAVDSLCVIDNENGEITKNLDRSKVYYIQTPQGFVTEKIKKAYSLAKNSDYTDDSAVYAAFIEKPRIFEGDVSNIKLTFKKDFDSNMNFYTGTGFDAHRLTSGRKLIIGGVDIPHTEGLLGHSDADVLTHAIMDALLSSAGLRDIGFYFPDSDNKYKDISSIELLKKVSALLTQKNFTVQNISAVIIAEKPKLSAYINEMKKNISAALKISEDAVGITASTSEKMGFTGRKEGIATTATVLTYKIKG